MAGAPGRRKPASKAAFHGIVSLHSDAVSRLQFMTMFSTVRFTSRDWRDGHLLPIALAAALTAGAAALVAYLLWPTWSTDGSNAPDRLPVSIGGPLFNLPPAALRMQIQR